MKRISKKHILALASIALVLGACGNDSTQTDLASAPIAEAVFTEATPDEDQAPDGETTVSGTDEAPVGTAENAPSPLAGQFTALPSALPEVALAGRDEPVGDTPLSIALPSLGIDDAPIVPVGLEDNGELEIPGASEVGWYQFGVGIDGGRGSTVLAAHINYNGVDGVFRHLVDLEPGDRFTVSPNGQPVEYVVESVVDYGKQTLPIADLFSETGDERLVLITCGGDFNPSIRSYDDNTVVVATPVSAP